MKKLGVSSVTSLFRFMLLFQINRFEILKLNGSSIEALVGWADDGSPHYDREEEVQLMDWDVQYFDNMDDALLLAEYFIDNRFIQNDKISISRDLISDQIKWDQERLDLAIETLLELKVDMVDEGKKTDYFFLHF